MTRTRTFVATALMLAFLGTLTPALAAKDYRAERYDVKLLLQADGSMQVTETITFAFGRDSFTYVFREIPTRRTDGIDIVGAAIDGRPLTPGKQPGQYEVRRADNGRRRIVWHFDSTTATTRTFEASYRVRGVVELSKSADLVRWRVLPSDHEYVIGCASLTISQPPGARLLEPPVLEPAPTRVSAEGPTLAYELCPVNRDRSWVVSARFAPGTVTAVLPAWQERGARHGAFLPMFLGLAGFILAGGILAFVVFGLNHRGAVRQDASSRLPEPPQHQPAGLGVALARNGHAHGPVAFAALLDMASRGVVRIQEVEARSRFTKHEFAVVPGDRFGRAGGHERVLLDLLFTSKSGSHTSAKLADLGKILQSPGRWKRFTTAIRDDLGAAGLIDAARERTRASVQRVSVGMLFLAILGFAATIPFVRQLGPASLLLPGAVALTAVAGFIVSSTLPILTDDGLRRAGLWAAHGRYLTELAKGGDVAPGAEAFGRALPYAAGFGVALAWAKALEKRGMTTGAPWLQALAGQQEGGGTMGATVAMLSAGHSASGPSGAGAGGAGAGAAGGGSSGAG